MPLVEFKDVSHTYPPDRRALRSINLQIKEGEHVGLIGPSGAGKSTLLRVINGLVIPTAGKVEVLGQAVNELSETDLMRLRRRIGMIFQEGALIERLPVLTNVLVGRLGFVPTATSLMRLFPREETDKALNAINEVGLAGYEGQLVRKLSGGQKQRVGIARALVQGAEIILGDEPTASLDVRTSEEILDLLKKLALDHGVTLILSLHDVRAARRFCDRIIAMSDGAVVWDGAAADFDEMVVEQVFYPQPTAA
jgi:phosphonate transport system ATP-binding protein